MNEAVRLSGIGRTELYRLMREGKVQAKKHGRHTLVMMASVQAYISELPDATMGQGAHLPVTGKSKPKDPSV